MALEGDSEPVAQRVAQRGAVGVDGFPVPLGVVPGEREEAVAAAQRGAEHEFRLATRLFFAFADDYPTDALTEWALHHAAIAAFRSNQFGESVRAAARLVNEFPQSENLPAAQYIQQHYAEKITIDRLAEYCGVSSRQLAGLFSTRLNMNFSTYLCYFRISKAIELMELREGRCPLTQLALDCGFGGLSHFSRVFKEKMGLSPTRYFSAQLR